jgi:hypothetical protein
MCWGLRHVLSTEGPCRPYGRPQTAGRVRTGDVFGRSWRDPHYAVCESLETAETHMFGDVIFRSEPVAVEGRKRIAKRR